MVLRAALERQENADQSAIAEDPATMAQSDRRDRPVMPESSCLRMDPLDVQVHKDRKEHRVHQVQLAQRARMVTTALLEIKATKAIVDPTESQRFLELKARQAREANRATALTVRRRAQRPAMVHRVRNSIRNVERIRLGFDSSIEDIYPIHLAIIRHSPFGINKIGISCFEKFYLDIIS